MTPENPKLVPHWRDLFAMGSYRDDHWVALRVGLAVGVPLLALWATGRVDLAIFAVFGAFTSVFGRRMGVVSRLRIQSIAAITLVVSVLLGALVSLSPERDLLVLPAAAVWAFAMSLFGDRVQWKPPGPMFHVFALAAIAALAVEPAVLVQGAAVTLGTAVWSLLIGLGAGGVGRVAKAVGLEISDVHMTPTTSVPTAPPLVRVSRVAPSLKQALIFGVGSLIAGAIPIVIGIGHPYWAIVSVIAGLAAATGFHRVLRASQRLVGTVIGLGIAAVILLFDPNGLPLILLVIALQAGVELFIVRNYALGLLFLTPLVLVMGVSSGQASAGQLILERGVETAIGVAVAIAMAVVLDAWDRRR